MPSTTAISQYKHTDPLKSLAKAIGSALGTNGRSSATAVHQVLHQVLESATLQSRNTRMQLIRHLVDIEAGQAGITAPVSAPVQAAADLISTAEAADLLGYSRPYVAMLIDQHQLEGATKSPGGHRRVPRASVMEWKARHQVQNPGNLRTESIKTGAYAASEAEAIKRIRKLREA